MSRSVVVKLEAKVGDYVAPVGAATAATEELDRKVKQTNEDIGKTEPASRRAMAAMKALGVEAGGTRVKFEEFGRGAGSSLQALDQRIMETRATMRQFADEFNRTGLVSAFERWKQATRDLSDLAKLRKELAGVVAEVQKLQGMGGSDTGRGGLLGLLGKVPGALNDLFNPKVEAGGGIGAFAKAVFTNPVGIAGVLAFASQLGVMIGGAITTGVGLAGIGAGVALALHDPRVQPAIANLKRDVSSGLKDAAQPFVQQTRDAVGIFDREFETRLPGIKKAFAAIAPETTGLAHGAAGFLGNMVDGIDSLLVASRPLIHEFGQWLPGFGKDIGGIFQEIGAHSKEAEQGLRIVEDGLHGLAVGGKEVIPVLSKVWDVAQNFSAETLWYKGVNLVAGTNATPELVHTAAAASVATAAIKDMRLAAQDLNITNAIALGYWERINADLVKAAQNFDRVFGITMTTQQAQLGLAQAVSALSDSISQNGKHWDISTKAGQANRAAVLQEEQAILSLRDANIQSGMSAADANAQYEAQQAALRKTLAAAGLTTQQINDLIGAYAQVPDKVSTSVNAPGLASATSGVGQLGTGYKQLPDKVETYINTPGLGSASSAIAQYRDYVNSIPKSVTTQVYINTPGPSSRSASAQRWGGAYEHAATGLLNAGIYPPMNPARYAFAEPATQGEAFIPKRGNLDRSRDIWSYVGRNWLGMNTSPTVSVAPPQVQVFIGDEDFTDRVRVVVRQENHATAAAVAGGTRL